MGLRLRSCVFVVLLPHGAKALLKTHSAGHSVQDTGYKKQHTKQCTVAKQCKVTIQKMLALFEICCILCHIAQLYCADCNATSN